jgi:hypothetical protein
MEDLYTWLSFDREIRCPEDLVKVFSAPATDTEAQVRTWGLFLDWVYQAEIRHLRTFLQLATGRCQVLGEIQIGWRYEVEDADQSESASMLIPYFYSYFCQVDLPYWPSERESNDFFLMLAHTCEAGITYTNA